MDTHINDMLTKTQQVSIMDLGKQLLEAASNGQSNKVHELMCRGAPFTTDWLGKSPLHMAAENNRLQTCEILLRAGISKDSRTKVDRTPLHLAVFNGHDKIVKLLLDHEADVNAKDMHKMTALHWAVEEEHTELVKLLLKHGASPVAMSKYGETPLSIAEEMGYREVVEILLANGSRVSQEEQQVATDCLLDEMEKDKMNHINLDSSDDTPAMTYRFPANMNSSNQIKSPSLQMLGDDMTADDTNTFLQSAYACGRRIIVTDFGKQMMLKVQNPNPNTVTLPTVVTTVQARNGDVKQTKPHMNVLIPNSSGQKLVAKSNILKRISSEELTKLVSDGKFASVGNSSSAAITNGSIRFPKYRLTSLAKVPNTDSLPNTTAVKLISKATPMPSAPIVPQPISALNTKKMVVKKESQITSANDANHVRSTTATSQPAKLEHLGDIRVQISMNEYIELKKRVQNLSKQCLENESRILALEKHCGLR